MVNNFRRRRLVATFLLFIVLAGIGVGVYEAVKGPSLTPAQLAVAAEEARLAALRASELVGATKAERLVNVTLPRRTGALAPVAPNRLFVHPMLAHQVMGFVPYWTLGDFAPGSFGSADLASATTLIYSSVCVGANGAQLTSAGDCANGATGLSSGAFSTFAQFAHLDHDRVLLSVQALDPGVIHRLVSHPAANAERLAQWIYPLMVSNALDGINIDVEGRAIADRAGYVTFVADLSHDLLARNAHLELVVDTYPQSAAGSNDFYNVQALARSVNYLFDMAYQMENATHSSANSPLINAQLGWSDVQSLVQYTAIVPSKKIILGLPLYGLNFATRTSQAGSQLVTNAPGARLYSDIVAAGRPALWDVGSETPFTVFRQNGGWHQDWYDDPVSLALKTALAQTYHLAGVGVWAFSQEGGDPSILAALTGGRAPVKQPLLLSAAG